MFCCGSCFILVGLLCVLSTMSCQVPLLLWLRALMCFTCVDCPTCRSLSECVYSLCVSSLSLSDRLLSFSGPVVVPCFCVSILPCLLVSTYFLVVIFSSFVFLALFDSLVLFSISLIKLAVCWYLPFVLCVCILGPLLFKSWQKRLCAAWRVDQSLAFCLVL